MHRDLVDMHDRCNFNLKCCASPPWRFSILKGRFCFLSLMNRHISILKTVCRPCGKRLPSKSGYSGV